MINTHFMSFKVFSITDCFLLKNIFLQKYSSIKSKNRLKINIPKIINILSTIILIWSSFLSIEYPNFDGIFSKQKGRQFFYYFLSNSIIIKNHIYKGKQSGKTS